MDFISIIQLVLVLGGGVFVNAQGYNPGEEVSFNDHLWSRSVSQPVVDFLTDHLSFIDDTSGTNETANAESELWVPRPNPLLTNLRLRDLPSNVYLRRQILLPRLCGYWR